MPEIFQKDCKLKVIEYGSANADLDFIKDMKQAIISCVKRFIK